MPLGAIRDCMFVLQLNVAASNNERLGNHMISKDSISSRSISTFALILTDDCFKISFCSVA
jgi:hypothetical protein